MKHCPKCQIDVRPIQDMQPDGRFADQCPECMNWLGDRGNPMKDAAEQTRAVRQAKRPAAPAPEMAKRLAGALVTGPTGRTQPSAEPAHAADPAPIAQPITAAVLIAQAQDRIAVIDQELTRMASLQVERAQLQRMIDAAKPVAQVVRLVENDHA